MSDAIQPALTAEEWAQHASYGEIGNDASARVDAMQRYVTGPDAPRFDAAAALALHGQPFGFTRAHVELLREAAHFGPEGYRSHGIDPQDFAAEINALADRLAALLPPETP